ncbi:MAG: HAMP domain-containing protein [Alphaproteobacteria bacterium]|nr:HAMP domain-containing protein [Alphaproteobacteria bacterium]
MALDAPKPSRVSLLTLRILVIIVFPTAMFFIGLLHLDQYRDTVLESELDALYRQGNTLARTIGLADAEYSVQAQRRISELTIHRAQQLIASIPDARIRIFQPNGAMIIDSADGGGLYPQNIKVTPRDDMVQSDITRWLQGMVSSLAAVLSPQDNYPLYRDGRYLSVEDFPLVQPALLGEPTRMIMRDRKGKLILGVALPIRNLRVVRGALLVTASGEQAERDITEVQYTFFQVFFGILMITIILGMYLSQSIVGPITTLARRANQVRLNQGQSLTLPDLINRRDEIGILARDLSAMTDELNARMKATASFAADVSHELKNPLTSLRSAVETMARLDDKAQQDKLMQIILDDVGRLNRLISDISAASRLDADLSEAEYETIDLGDLIRNFVNSRRLTLDGQSKVALQFQTPKTPVMARVVVDRLVQVLDNLFVNATSFSPDGGVIVLSLQRKGDDAVVTMADDGPGIPENKRDTIFNRFYSERPEGETFGRHSGLGLSISRQIIEALGGKITANNRKRRRGAFKTGAEMVITLPIVKTPKRK